MIPRGLAQAPQSQTWPPLSMNSAYRPRVRAAPAGRSRRFHPWSPATRLRSCTARSTPAPLLLRCSRLRRAASRARVFLAIGAIENQLLAHLIALFPHSPGDVRHRAPRSNERHGPSDGPATADPLSPPDHSCSPPARGRSGSAASAGGTLRQDRRRTRGLPRRSGARRPSRLIAIGRKPEHSRSIAATRPSVSTSSIKCCSISRHPFGIVESEAIRQRRTPFDLVGARCLHLERSQHRRTSS